MAAALGFRLSQIGAAGFIPAGLTTQRKTEATNRELNRACPVCGNANHLPQWQKGDLRLVRCSDCTMIFANPAPAGMASGEFYDTEGADYYLSPAKLESDYADVRFARELKLFREFCPRGAVLDVGCGSGGFLYQVHKRWPADYKILGTDVSGAPLDYAESRGVPVIRGNFLNMRCSQAGISVRTQPSPVAVSVHSPAELGEGRGEGFDIITFWAVLEHLADPGKFLIRANALLNRGGNCFVLVPNVRSLAHRILGSKYRYVYPQHLNYFSATTLNQLARICGFETVSMRFTHFNPMVIWQDLRSDGREVSNEARAKLLKQTTAYKQRPWLKPVKWVYRLTEKFLAGCGLADNLVVVLRKKPNR